MNDPPTQKKIDAPLFWYANQQHKMTKISKMMKKMKNISLNMFLNDTLPRLQLAKESGCKFCVLYLTPDRMMNLDGFVKEEDAKIVEKWAEEKGFKTLFLEL